MPRLTQSEDPAYPHPQGEREILIDQFLNCWQWGCPTVEARRHLLQLIEDLQEDPVRCPILEID